MSAVASSLSVNLSHVLQKNVHLLDLQYDHYCKYLAAGCRSQNGSEVVILEKDASDGDSGSFHVVSSVSTRCDPVLLCWAPPQFGRILVVALSDNSISYYQHAPSSGVWQLSLYHEKREVQKSISCMSVGVSPKGELLCAVGSPSGSISVIFCEGSFECVDFPAHCGGVSSVCFAGNDSVLSSGGDGRPCLLASGGSDGCVKVWQLFDRKFQLLKTLSLECDSKSLTQVKCLCWNKSGDRLAVGTGAELLLFGGAPEWSESQRVGLPRASVKVSVSFSNDRLVVSCDNECFVYRADERGAYALSGPLEASNE
ncbi:COPII-coated vesicle component Sec13 [Babesia ovata]|uniref:COPII-coated vesicle component Sec13 n=1 Tax=Babesia ovata TaxID=189622 RepID=A0A2H6K8G5_9APIC|nr:COPII-coated vesicle component Sec13 [Babesia ovata]GBE59284.1 COPII-coated vesicle component Sec13 [Babesia ovata]